tara:strand:+ start:422 stop:772 length:351 start_codon:yes stop_codon:yes gene_type:complete
MTTKKPIAGAWVVIRTCPYDGTESILGLFPEGKAALLKLEHFMDTPEDNEEYKIEFHMFKSVEQELEAIQRCKANRAEWDEKSRVYENYKAEQESKEIDKLLEEEYNEETDAASYT